MSKSGIFASAFVAVGMVGGVAWADATLHPNSQAYRVSKPPAATGRAGNANLAVRALMNKDGTTDFDLTTGVLDSSAVAPGNISKVQFKVFNGNGDVQWTKNFSSLTKGGTLRFSFADLQRGQPVQTQANIDKIDKRTSVVTVTGGVKLRPDLSVAALSVPAQARLGTPLDITAVVSELNGDIGATGDCKLFVDGTQVDQALGIYVDAAGVVSCAFNYKFDVAGSHTVRVVVDGAVPADYDVANNARSATIDVTDLRSEPIGYYASVYWYTASSHTHEEGSYRGTSDGSTWTEGSDWASDTAYNQHYWQADLSGWSSSPVSFPLQSAEVIIRADGTAATSSLPNVNSYTWSYSYGGDQYTGGCDSRWGVYDYWYGLFTRTWLCSNTWNGVTSTWLGHNQYAGDVTYHSQGYQRNWSAWYGTYDYSWNYDGGYSYGQSFPVASQVELAPTWIDADGKRFAPVATVALTAQSGAGCNQPLTCSTYTWDWGSNRYCMSCESSYSQLYGYTSGTTP